MDEQTFRIMLIRDTLGNHQDRCMAEDRAAGQMETAMLYLEEYEIQTEVEVGPAEGFESHD